MSYACPCCGYKTLTASGGGTFEICPVCHWEDDNVQHDDPDYEGGANGISLRNAQASFTASDAGQSREYERDANWKPL
jgi:hypothetical protein